MDHVSRPRLAEGHVQGIQDQLGSQMVGHRPADDPAAPDIDDDRQIEKPRQGRGIEPAPAKAGVMSATHSWFGPAAWKARSPRSGAGRACLSRRVVIGPPRRRLAPTRPATRISRAIRLAAVPLSDGPQQGQGHTVPPRSAAS